MTGLLTPSHDKDEAKALRGKSHKPHRLFRILQQKDKVNRSAKSVFLHVGLVYALLMHNF